MLELLPMVSTPGNLTARLLGADAHAYWLSGHTSHPYGRPPGSWDAFLYSPAFALAVRPLTLLPWPVFFAAWALAEATMIAWLLKPLGLVWAIPCFMLCLSEIRLGNVNGLFGLVMVFGFRYPGLWAFPILTKILPGVGALWFVLRGEWRKAIGVAVTVAAVAVPAILLAPDMWEEWWRFLTTQGSEMTVGRATRLAGGLVLLLLAAQKNKPVLLPLVMFLASPVVSGATLFSLLAAMPRLSNGHGVTARKPELQLCGGHVHQRGRTNGTASTFSLTRRPSRACWVRPRNGARPQDSSQPVPLKGWSRDH